MTVSTKQELFSEVLGRYLTANREEKKVILNELVATTKMHRKSVIRALKRIQLRDPSAMEHRGRSIQYGHDVTAALQEIWEIAGEICAERLHPIVREYVSILKRDSMWTHTDHTTGLLCAMSIGTMKSRLSGLQKARTPRGVSTTKPSELKELIPVRRWPWKNPKPGYGQVDTVVHCGSTLRGDMAYTTNYTDIATTWVESAAQLNKGQIATQESIERIKKRLPFQMKGIHGDTGSEFINWHLVGWCKDNDVELSRSRPNHKNDNAHIEQKNYSGVRKFLGYARIEQPKTIALMNELYAGPLRLYINFFQPSMKLVKKMRIGSRYKRVYDTALTPYQRVLKDERISQTVKDNLQKQYATLNPAILRKEIDRIINKIFNPKRARRH